MLVALPFSIHSQFSYNCKAELSNTLIHLNFCDTLSFRDCASVLKKIDGQRLSDYTKKSFGSV